MRVHIEAIKINNTIAPWMYNTSQYLNSPYKIAF